MIPRDVEGEMIAALKGALSGVHVSTRVPNPRPVSHVRVRRVGGTGQNLVQERPMVLVECWAGSSVAAFELAAKCFGVLDAAYCGPGNRPGAPINLPDPNTDSDRYQFHLMPYINLKESP